MAKLSVIIELFTATYIPQQSKARHFCASTATVVTGTLLNITPYVLCPSCKMMCYAAVNS